MYRVILALLLFSTTPWAAVDAIDADEDFLQFNDQPLAEPLTFPDWFKLSFLDMAEDLAEARAAGKAGLIIYYGQKYCAYCRQFLEKDLAREDIRNYMLEHYDVIGIDIHGLRGYYPPYRFRAALEYVADGHFRNERFREYLARADVPLIFEPGDLSEEPFFLAGPYMLDRSRIRGERPLVVFFEQGNCHACDILHTGPLQDEQIRARLEQLETVQLSYWSDTPVITPAGERTTARRWAEQLGLFYTPTLIFFDTDGTEIIRVDSVVQFYRLRNVLDYILTGGYRRYATFQRWRESRRPQVFLE